MFPASIFVAALLASAGACSSDTDTQISLTSTPTSATGPTTLSTRRSATTEVGPTHAPSTAITPQPSPDTGDATSPTTARIATGAGRINLDVRHQMIDGFGISTRVWSDPHVSNGPQSVVPEAVQDAILELLIDDLGITRARPIIEAGIEPVNDNADPDVLAPGGFDFSGKRTDEHVALVAQMRERGVTVWFPSMLQPEPWMTEHTPREYVERVMAQLLRWDELAAVPPLVSPVNEPTLPIAGAFSTAWLVEVVRDLGRRIEDAGLPTRIVIPDDLDPTSGLAKATAVLADPEARRYVAALGYHLYGGDPADIRGFAELGARYGVPVWMTEFSRAEWSSFPAVLEWATMIHELLTGGGVSAVDYLWGFFGGQELGHSLVSIEFGDGEYQSHAPTAAYWVTGQWSRFVRPGFLRVEANADGAQLSAFVDPSGGALVVVAVNASNDASRVEVELAGGLIDGDIDAVRSSATEQWAELTPPPRQDGSFTAELPAASVTTFIVPLAG